MKQKLKYFVAKLINKIIPKRKNSIFAEPHPNSKAEKQDYINYSGDSVLSMLNYISANNYLINYTIDLIIYDIQRKPILEKYLKSHKINNITLVLHYSCYTGIQYKIKQIKYNLRKMQSMIWICATVHSNKRFSISCQKLICLGYFISFKNDFNCIPFEYLPKNWSLMCSTSMLDSTIKSAAFAIPFECFNPLGMPRNDILFSPHKENEIQKWIYEKTGNTYSKIIIYAPTFRDYEINSTTHKRNLWGYKDNQHIVKILQKKNAIVIAKLHSWQNTDVIDSASQNVLFYEPNYNFSIYDIMTIADLLISDYSSIGLDFLLTDKPVIYNLYDKDKYFSTRGMSFEPVEEFYAGDIVIKESDLAKAIEYSLDGNIDKNKYNHVKNLFFKYQDSNSCKRIYDYLVEKEVFQ